MEIGEAVWVLTRDASLMPGCVVAVNLAEHCPYGPPLKGGNLMRVMNQHGAEYTCKREIVLEFERGLEFFREFAGRRLAEDGYTIAARPGGTYRVYQPERHGARGGWVVYELEGKLRCTCPADAYYGWCKHALAVHQLLRNRALDMRERGRRGVATRYTRQADGLRAMDTGREVRFRAQAQLRMGARR